MPQHKKCEILSSEIHYWIYNPEGKSTIVAVHGLRGTHHGLQFIAQQLPDYRFIIPDLPGFGESEPLRKKHDIENYSNFLKEFLRVLRLEQRPVLLGHSFGSIITSYFSVSHPSTISKLVLINPIAESPKPISQIISKGYYGLGQLLPGKVGKSWLSSRLVTRLMTVSLLKTKNKQRRKRAYEQHFAYFATFASKRSLHEAFTASHTHHVSSKAAGLNLPVLLIVGAKDVIAPLRSQQQLHKNLKAAKLHVIPNVGHLIHYETPELAAKYIREFIE